MRGAAQGLLLAAGSGVLYGSINVLAKRVEAHPLAMAAVAYLASAAALAPFLRGLRIARGDGWRFAAMGLVGGGLAPVLLFFGLRQASAADAALLLTTEMVATAAFAALWLRERFRRREMAGLAFLLAAAVLVGLSAGGAGGSTAAGAALILGAALAWGVDNTVSAHLVGAYRPHQLIAAKGLLGGAASAAAALALRAPAPGAAAALQLVGLGLASIALSSLLFYHALRKVGAARTSALNVATTALVGAFGGALLLGERLGPLHATAVAAVLAGAWLLGRPGQGRAPVALGPG